MKTAVAVPVKVAPQRSVTWITRFLETPQDWGAAIARVALGLVMFPHGAQKLFGWLGGPGFGASMDWFTRGAGIPGPVALLVILGESLGALALVAGLAGRFMAAGIAVIMAGAVLLVHAPHGFFMNWFGAQAGEGFEYHLLAIALGLVVTIRGSGAWSLDRRIVSRLS